MTNILVFSTTQFISNTRFYLSTLASCLTSSSVSGIPIEWFDYRYFYGHNGLGYYTCGLTREAVVIVIRKGSPGRLSNMMWLSSLCTFKNNPFIVRFLVKQACLSFISSIGFHHGNLNWGPFEATIFEGNLISAIPLGDCKIFFIPQASNFKDIDVLYHQVDHLQRIVTHICTIGSHKYRCIFSICSFSSFMPTSNRLKLNYNTIIGWWKMAILQHFMVVQDH